jgi:uncharacterized cupredoxin-like copper-binding protein
MFFAILTVLAALLMVGAACGGDDAGGGLAPAHEFEGSPLPEGLELPPQGASPVTVRLREWEVLPLSTGVVAGPVYFLVDNVSPATVHELIIIETDDEPEDLPTEDGAVDESAVDVAERVPGVDPRSGRSTVVNLRAGDYVLICNIVEETDAGTVSHYEMGMRAALAVSEAPGEPEETPD